LLKVFFYELGDFILIGTDEIFYFTQKVFAFYYEIGTRGYYILL